MPLAEGVPRATASSTVDPETTGGLVGPAGKAPGDGATSTGCAGPASAIGRAMATGTVGADAPTVGGTEASASGVDTGPKIVAEDATAAADGAEGWSGRWIADAPDTKAAGGADGTA